MDDSAKTSHEDLNRQAVKTAMRRKTAGEVRFIKDRGSDKAEWAWGTPGPSAREIGSDFEFNAKNLKPLAATLRATLMAMGHSMSAATTFSRIKSAEISPDGNLGGKGYIQKITDMRRAYANVVEALSALSDTIHDEMLASHWKAESKLQSPRERDEVKEILNDAKRIEEDPEGWASDEEAKAEIDSEVPKEAKQGKQASRQASASRVAAAWLRTKEWM